MTDGEEGHLRILSTPGGAQLAGGEVCPFPLLLKQQIHALERRLCLSEAYQPLCIPAVGTSRACVRAHTLKW